MYEYKYVTIELGGGIWINNADRRHREAIDREAKDGWRYVGYVPIDFNGRGAPMGVDLIFERKADSPGAHRQMP